MKLLLTSGGLTNYLLRKKFLELVGKDPQNIKVAFINTASKAEKNINYVDEDLENLKKTGVSDIVFVDISEPKESWINILKEADVVWMEGGNTFYLLNEIRKSDLVDELKNIIGNKLYVGVSAGSILVTPTIDIANVEPADPNDVVMTDFTSLGWVDFEVSPHTPNIVSLENVESYSKKSGLKLYTYDDNVAILVVDGKVEILGNGFKKVFN